MEFMRPLEVDLEVDIAQQDAQDQLNNNNNITNNSGPTSWDSGGHLRRALR